MSGSWNGGYVTDVEYGRGYFASQAPNILALSCLINGFAVDAPWDSQHMHYLELGCGRGVTACVIAASNPGWRVTAIDFTPGAIAEARRLAAEAGLDNITFIEADLSDFAETAQARALPEADIITSHGVWSWVDDAVRAGMVRLVAAKLRAGGLMHLSYNALPAQQGMLAMQRVMREAGLRRGGRSDHQAIAGREVVQALAAAQAMHLNATPTTREMVERLGTHSVSYLAHEYMNEAWRPCFHADVANSLAAAKLDFVGSARLADNFVDLLLTPEQKAIHDRFEDPIMRELVIDTCINRILRHDVYIRGATRLRMSARDAALGRIRVALAIAPDQFRYALTIPAGHAQLNEAHYRPMVAALAQGTHSIAELIALGGPATGPVNHGEVAMVLVGTYQALVVSDQQAGPSERIHRFNTVMAKYDAHPDSLNAASAMASHRLGAGMAARAVEVLVASRIGMTGQIPDPAELAAAFMPEGPGRDEFASLVVDLLRDRLAVWQRLGVVSQNIKAR